MVVKPHMSEVCLFSPEENQLLVLSQYLLCPFYPATSHRRSTRTLDNEDTSDYNDDRRDIYIMMKCLFVCHEK